MTPRLVRIALWICAGTISRAAVAATVEPDLPAFPSADLKRELYRGGETTLKAFAPIAQETRYSVVRFNVNGEPVALGMVVDTNGLTVTKASELKKGKLTCWLADDTEADASVLATDDENDIALVRVQANGLRPIKWARGGAIIGQWAVTPGIIETPHAVGIVSALPHRIRPEQAFVGVKFEIESAQPRIREVVPGMGAEKAGLKAGDIIAAVNHVTATNREQVVELVREFRAGQTINILVQRAEKKFGVDITLMKPPEAVMSSFAPRFADRTYRRLSGQVSARSEGFTQVIEHDTVLKPWLCGGPLVNLDGEAIGLNIARAGRASTYALPADLVQHVVQKFKLQQLQ